MQIFKNRIEKCSGHSIDTEINYLYNHNIPEYHRSHELYAYKYFTQHNNRNRVTCDVADFEYIPFLPLGWKIRKPTHTNCTAGGVCPNRDITSQICDIKYFADDIVEYINFSSKRKYNIPRFIVASTFNLKTVLSFALPTQKRSGKLFEQLSTFIETTYLAHHERIPQCADILRKSWKYVVEIPYVPYMIKSLPHIHTAATRNIMFLYYKEEFKLWGPESICSIFTAMEYVSSNRSDLKTYSPHEIGSNTFHNNNNHFESLLKQSIFCIIIKTNSYSSSFLYISIVNDCIPIVISDWYVFSFRWYIPYHKFVIRVKEEDFLKNPNYILDTIVQTYTRDNNTIEDMKLEMRKWRNVFLYDTQEEDESIFSCLHSSDGSMSDNSITSSKSNIIVTPLNMLLYELKFIAFNITSIPSSDKCVTAINGPVRCTDPSHCSSGTLVKFDQSRLSDIRSHLCKHSQRLIGKYKIVFFMQCVKVLWPLTPGNLLKVDLRHGGITPNEVAFLQHFHNITISNNAIDSMPCPDHHFNEYIV
jgi:hypothetical protein